MCNCEFCIKCDNCGHQADEHIAGDGSCFRCACGQFTSSIVKAWDNVAKDIRQTKYLSFQQFADEQAKENDLQDNRNIET